MNHVSHDFAAPQSDLDVEPALKVRVPQLLVSVRDRDELAATIGGGIDIIDLKEPRLGPLAPADLGLWSHAASLRETSEAMQPLSAALGERTDAIRVADRLPGAFTLRRLVPAVATMPTRCVTCGQMSGSGWTIGSSWSRSLTQTAPRPIAWIHNQSFD